MQARSKAPIPENCRPAATKESKVARVFPSQRPGKLMKRTIKDAPLVWNTLINWNYLK